MDYPRVQTQLLVLHLALVRNMSEEYVEHCAIIVSSTLSNSVTECEREVLSLLTASSLLKYILQVDTQMCDDGCLFFGMQGAGRPAVGGCFVGLGPAKLTAETD